MAGSSNLVEPWGKGMTGNPNGRPIGGRMRALRALDDILNEKEVADTIAGALRKKALKDPLEFFMAIIMPLLPKQPPRDESEPTRLILKFDVVGRAKKEKVIDVEAETNRGE